MSESVVNENVPVIHEVPAEDGDPPQQTAEVVNNVAASPSLVAPFLRVEQIKDEDGTSSVYTSEEEGDGDRDKSPEPEFHPPTDELRDKIIKQVEFYFSDVNILKDAFLLKHVRRNRQGYVSIKLITSFKKVKSLTKDYRAVAYSLRQSEHLEVNEEGKKVRRKDPLPEYDETTPSRSVVAVNLPMETPSIENVAELFSKCGEVSLIRILRPGKSIPQDVKKYAAKYTEIGTTVCCVVEFEKHESAKLACDTMTDTEDWRKGMRVMLLAPQKKKDKKKDKEGNEENEGEEGEENNEKKKKRRERRKKNRVDQLAQENDSSYASSGSEADTPTPSKHSIAHHQKSLSPNHLDPNKLSPSNSPRSSPRSSPLTSPRSRRRNQHTKSPLTHAGSPSNSPRNSPRSSPEMGRKTYDYSSGGDSTPSSPWVQRRLKAAQEISPLANQGNPGRSPNGRHHLLDMEGVVRQPKGPDGTPGFHLGRGKPRSSTFS